MTSVIGFMGKRWRDAPMVKPETLTTADIDVPVERRATLEQKRVDEIAVSNARLAPANDDPDAVRRCCFVLVEGLHRLDARKH